MNHGRKHSRYHLSNKKLNPNQPIWSIRLLGRYDATDIQIDTHIFRHVKLITLLMLGLKKLQCTTIKYLYFPGQTGTWIRADPSSSNAGSILTVISGQGAYVDITRVPGDLTVI